MELLKKDYKNLNDDVAQIDIVGKVKQVKRMISGLDLAEEPDRKNKSLGFLRYLIEQREKGDPWAKGDNLYLSEFFENELVYLVLLKFIKLSDYAYSAGDFVKDKVDLLLSKILGIQSAQ
jgi:hypothetical protein